MSIKQELNHKLFVQREENAKHLSYETEFAFYKSVAAGDLKEVQAISEYIKSNAHQKSTHEKNGLLSQDPLRNDKYHFVVLAAMLTRYCVEAGLEREVAYSLSDIYIQKMDLLPSIADVHALQDEMIIEFTKQMMDNRKKNVFSRQITKCIDYVYENLHEKITVASIAEELNINESYLSKLFITEVGVSLSAYIKKQRLNAAANMLNYTDYSIADISEYLNFSSQSHFTSSFVKEYGISPKKYRDMNSKKSMPE